MFDWREGLGSVQWRTPVTLFLIAVLVVVGGCRKGGVRADGGDHTGRLGQIQQASPADVYVQLAAQYLKTGQLTIALQNAKKAVIVDPSYATAHTVLGLVYQQLGERSEAGAAFEKAVARDPFDPYALNAYGSFLCSNGQQAEAQSMFERALQNPLYETPWIALTNAGICAEQLGHMGQAETYFRQALQRNNKFAPALLRMANISFEKGSKLSARAYLQRFSEVQEHTAESLWLGIRTETMLGDRDQAASYGLLLRARFPDSRQVQLLDESRMP
jgi:type IV pilus assembly protein PilF